jgi:hypothetical protein
MRYPDGDRALWVMIALAFLFIVALATSVLWW